MSFQRWKHSVHSTKVILKPLPQAISVTYCDNWIIEESYYCIDVIDHYFNKLNSESNDITIIPEIKN